MYLAHVSMHKCVYMLKVIVTYAINIKEQKLRFIYYKIHSFCYFQLIFLSGLFKGKDI